MKAALIAAALVCAPPAAAQVVVAPPRATVDTSTLATKAEVQAVAATACQPQAAVPPMETVGGDAGSGNACRLANAVQPRITRAASCTLSASGSCTVTWATALASTPTVIMTPINTGTMPVMCNLTAAPTTTTASIKCWTAQTVTVSVLGAVVAPVTTSAAGFVIQLIAIPQTQ